jgi:peptidoglycan/LPS O-acetylase OafA/YrhL
LGLGALIAVLAPTIAKLRAHWIRESFAFCGMASIAVSALVLTASTPYPGSVVALPVIGSGLLIAAGCGNARTAVARVLALRPMQWIGARSYSLYLWHWPILIIAREFAGHSLSASSDTGLILLAIVASAMTFRFVENPVRRAHVLSSRPILSLAIGATLILGTIAVAQAQIASHYGSWDPMSVTSSSGP